MDNKAKLLAAVKDTYQKSCERATARYTTGFDSRLYQAAVGKNHERGNRLINKAMALCGHPSTMTFEPTDQLSEAELAFLARFGTEVAHE